MNTTVVINHEPFFGIEGIKEKILELLAELFVINPIVVIVGEPDKRELFVADVQVHIFTAETPRIRESNLKEIVHNLQRELGNLVKEGYFGSVRITLCSKTAEESCAGQKEDEEGS